MEGSRLEATADLPVVNDEVNFASSTMNDLDGACPVNTGPHTLAAGGEEERAGRSRRGAGS